MCQVVKSFYFKSLCKVPFTFSESYLTLCIILYYMFLAPNAERSVCSLNSMSVKLFPMKIYSRETKRHFKYLLIYCILYYIIYYIVFYILMRISYNPHFISMKRVKIERQLFAVVYNSVGLCAA